MNLNNQYTEIRQEFQAKLSWFEEEFDLIFRKKAHSYTREEIKLAYHLLNKLTNTINEYRDTSLISPLVSTLKTIEKKHPEFF